MEQEGHQHQIDKEQQLFNLGHFVDSAMSHLHEMDFATIYKDPTMRRAYRDLEDSLAEIRIGLANLK